MTYGKGWRRGIAITFAFIMVTSVAIPAGAIGSTSVATAGNEAATAQTTTDSTTDRSNSTKLPADAPPAVLKYEAVRRTANLSAGDKRGIQSNIDRARDRFNTSLSYFTGPVRVNDSKAFTHDAVGIRALAHTVRTDNTSRAKRIVDLVYEADNATATATVADARRLLDRYGDGLDNQGLRQSAEAHLDNAERALDRAQAIPGDVDGRRYFGQRARAVTKLRLAHRQASLAMRFVDRDVSPNVTVASADDPVWDGTGNRTYVVRGNVSTVRPGTLENVTVTVNGDRTTVARTNLAIVTPGSNASYVARVNLTDRVNRIEVTATEGASDGQNDPGQSDTAVLRLDGDGLTGTYETETVGTDPLDPNSDSTATAADESTNATIDGSEDFDGDGLSTIQEAELGTDPLVSDTDGDGLTDSQEVNIVRTDPLSTDSDSKITDRNESGNGIADAAEDLDGDGLTVAQELANGSSPLYNDTDADGLADPEEIDRGTDPRNPDTDGDFLGDAEELSAPFDTDPLDPDTDGDGVVDGNETYTTVASNESMGVSVALTGEGNVSAETGITPPAHVRFSGDYGPGPAAVGSLADISVDRSFESATVSVEYNESAIQTNESSLGLYRFNESSGAYERLPTTVDAANDTMTGTADHFSVIVPMDAGYARQIVRQRSQLQPNESSGSSPPTDTPSFDFETSSPVEITSGSSATVNGVTWSCRNDPRGGGHNDTPISGECAIADGNATVREETNRMRYLETEVTLPEVASDEAIYINASVVAHIEAAWSNAGVRLIVNDANSPETDVFRLEQDYGSGTKTVSATPRMDITEMAGETVTISFQANGRHTYQNSNTMSELYVDSLEIDTSHDAEVDRDGDGIDDTWEEGGVPLANTTRTVHLDPHDPDTDGDGIRDGTEIDMSTFHADQNLSDADVIHFPGFAWSSDPTAEDTDDDGLSDPLERDGWNVSVVNRSSGPNPYRFDKQCRRTGIRSGQIQWTNCEAPDQSIKVSSDPKSQNSDSDSLSDYVEYNSTYTDPEDERTYGITNAHQQFIDNMGSQAGLKARLGIKGVRARDYPELDDATDDFDFLLTSGSGPRERAVFTALDGEDRTDQWLSNLEEVRYGGSASNALDPWDPDTDDDGLTDGQEISGLTISHGGNLRDADRVSYDTDPTLPDTDGDGYWDGWIGVYNVSRSDNVVLYGENLRDDDNNDGDRTNDGILGEEIVQKQIHYHDVTEVSSAIGADIDDDGVREHSNVHLGELIWGTNATEQGETPSPEFSIQVDYFEGANLSLDHPNWRQSIENNYRLYGIDLEMQRGEILSDQDIHYEYTTIAYNTDAPFSEFDIWTMKDEEHTSNTDYYMFVGNTSVNNLSNQGIHRNAWGSGYTAIFTDYFERASFLPSRYSFNPSQAIRNKTQPTAIHEIGHAFDLGESDDTTDEIYSGGPADVSEEFVDDPTVPGQQNISQWSAMTYANSGGFYIPPTGLNYTAISIEEWMSISRDPL